MQGLASFTAILAALVSTSAAVQVNFYYDRNCENYAGSQYFDLSAHPGSIEGGPFGASSAYWINDDGTGDWCKSYSRYWCSDNTCNTREAAVIGPCHSDFAQMWAGITCTQK